METLRSVVYVFEADVEINRFPLEVGRHWISRAPHVIEQSTQARSATIHLPHPDVDFYHAVLIVSADGVDLDHRSPRKSTRFAGEPLSLNEPRRLRDGARWEIGPFVLIYCLEARSTTVRWPLTLHPAELWPFKPVALPEHGGATEAPAGEERAAASAFLAGGAVPAGGKPAGAQARIERDELSPDGSDQPTVSRYLFDLPLLYQNEDGFLGRYLKIFEAIWEPLEQRQDVIDLYFDPRSCPPHLLDWLATWLQLPLDGELPEPRRRALVSEAYWLLRWRGTHFGLSRLLELATGAAPSIVVNRDQPYLIEVRMPKLQGAEYNEPMIVRMIEQYKPAHCAFSLEFQQ